MTLVIGHRGASFDAPENTVEAFVAAREQGADWVELDVRLSRDGHLVVRHDPLLADGRVIAETDRHEMDHTVATLEEALRACRPMGVNVEIKNSPNEPGHVEPRHIAALVNETIRMVAADQATLVSSFEQATIEAVRAHTPTQTVGLLVFAPGGAGDAIDAVQNAADEGFEALHPHHMFVNAELVERCHGVGLRLYTWTVDDPERIAELARWGVDGIITNRPALARLALER